MCVALLLGAAGVTAYVTGPVETISNQSQPVASRPSRAEIANVGDKIARTSNTVANHSNLAPSNIKQRDIERNSSTEPVYFCGALTKKGTPCTRRVKTKGRCWQHKGQPAVEDIRD